ncbi:dickkopf-related protein 3-like [Orbicella faveolata]|uniref:dickkopf-related protein 3-like n=1 Tax=Orbicella faveolata TaxID=48498 RepID=UPI0009E5B38E|nr:dickkopf-related protein 3-like [Orbicella faveolata]
MYLASALSKLRVNCQTLVMKRFMLLVIFVLASVEVADGVVYSWILSVNPVDTDEGKQTTSDNNTRENSTLQNPCRKDRHCGQGNYCHKHNGQCHACKAIDSQCRRNNMCCAGMECVFGVCRKALPRGSPGARCKKDRKCDSGLCCVKVHGEPICRRLLEEGEDCSVPEGGLDYSLNQKCPCEAGLICKKIKHRHRKRFVAGLDRKKRTCQRL